MRALILQKQISAESLFKSEPRVPLKGLGNVD